MENLYDTKTLAQELYNEHIHEHSAAIMSKCTKSCFISLKEASLLPTEEGCLRNCFIKSFNFKEFADQELRYTLRDI